MRLDYLGKMTVNYLTTNFFSQHNCSHLKTYFSWSQIFPIVTTKPMKRTSREKFLIKRSANPISRGRNIGIFRTNTLNMKWRKNDRRIRTATSAFKGHSFNEALLTGPYILCSLVGLLLRFWPYKKAANCDINANFHKSRGSRRIQVFDFSWTKVERKTNSSTRERHLVQKIPHHVECTCSTDVQKKIILNNFYIDDYNQSLNTIENAAIITTEVKKVLQKLASSSHKLSITT